MNDLFKSNSDAPWYIAKGWVLPVVELQWCGSVANESTLLVLIKYDFLLKPGIIGKTAVLLQKKVISFVSWTK